MPSIPEVVADFRDYYAANPSYGSLHIVLDGGNVADDHVQFCIEYARQNGDNEGERLARILLGMSRTQRRKLPYVVRRPADIAPLSVSV